MSGFFDRLDAELGAGRRPQADLAGAVARGHRRLLGRVWAAFVLSAVLVVALTAGTVAAAQDAADEEAGEDVLPTGPTTPSDDPKTDATKTDPTTTTTTTTDPPTEPTPLPAPTDLRVLSSTTKEVCLEWVAPADERVVAYEVLRDGAVVDDSTEPTRCVPLPDSDVHDYTVTAVAADGTVSDETLPVTHPTPVD